MRLHVFKDAAGEQRWTFIADNNRKVADSGEGYNHRQDALAGFALVRGVSVEELLSGEAGIQVDIDTDDE
jgi:uncharacterized protein YegP (UPF0339 family)